jgi:hypothetical protein
MIIPGFGFRIGGGGKSQTEEVITADTTDITADDTTHTADETNEEE